MASARPIQIIDPATKTGLPLSELQSLLHKWQTKLQLTDWQITLEIVDFLRTDYRQSGDFQANLATKKAKILLTAHPFLKEEAILALEEEHTLLHELIHILLWDLDSYSEKQILAHSPDSSPVHDSYLEKLEQAVEHFTNVFWVEGKSL